MNYHEARQRSDGSGWAWTTMNDGAIWTSGGCHTAGEPHAHATREEAERCFYDYEAGQLVEREYADTQHRCQFPDCTNWTSKFLEAGLLGAKELCDEHRNADGWRAANPFAPGLSITASW